MKKLFAFIFLLFSTVVLFAQLSAGSDQIICEGESTFLGGSIIAGRGQEVNCIAKPGR